MSEEQKKHEGQQPLEAQPLENLIAFASFSGLSRDKARQLLLQFLEDTSRHPDLSSSEKFLEFVYRYNPPLLTSEEVQKFLPDKDELFKHAINIGSVELVDMLIAQGADIHKEQQLIRAEQVFSQTPLHWAVARKNVALVQRLLDAGAKINTPNSKGEIPLQLTNDTPLIKLLLERGADIHLALKNAALRTTKKPQAIGKKDEKLPEEKSKQAPDGEAAKDSKTTPLPENETSSSPFKPAPYNPRSHLVSTYMRCSPLCDAVAKRDHKRVIQLLENGANPTYFNNDPYEPRHYRKNPLMIAASAGDIETLEILLSHKAVQDAINYADVNKKNALYYAIEGNHHEAVRLLLQHGAYFIAENALIAVADNGNPETIKLLMEDKRIQANPLAQNLLMGKKNEAKKFSRKNGTIIWKEDEFSTGSVIKLFDPKAKEYRYFKFVDNPYEGEDSEDIKDSKINAFGSGRYARTKCVVPVEPSYFGYFIQKCADTETTQVVRILNYKNHSAKEELKKQQRASNEFFSQMYNTPVLHGELGEKSYTVFPYMGMSLKNLFEECLEKNSYDEYGSYITDLLSIKQALELGLTICQTLENFHKKGYCHNDAHGGNLLVQLKDGQFIVNLIDFDRVSPVSPEGIQKDFDKVLNTLQHLYHKVLYGNACTMRQENLSILGKINLPLFRNLSFSDLIKSQSVALAEVEALLQDKPVHEAQGLLHDRLHEPQPKLSDLENLMKFIKSSATRDEANQALLGFFKENPAINVNQFLSERFLQLVYRYDPPLLTPEQFEKIFSGLSAEQFYWLLTKAVKLNLVNLLSMLTSKDLSPQYKNELLGQAVDFGHVEIVKLLIKSGADVHQEYSLDRDHSSVHQTLLHWIVQRNNIALAELLLDAKVDINKLNGKHQAPLHLAILTQNIPMMKLLLERGANPHLKGQDFNSGELQGTLSLIKKAEWEFLEERREARNLILSYRNSKKIQVQPKENKAAAEIRMEESSRYFFLEEQRRRVEATPKPAERVEESEVIETKASRQSQQPQATSTTTNGPPALLQTVTSQTIGAVIAAPIL